jgi:hypothetical protein
MKRAGNLSAIVILKNRTTVTNLLNLDRQKRSPRGRTGGFKDIRFVRETSRHLEIFAQEEGLPLLHARNWLGGVESKSLRSVNRIKEKSPDQR